MYQAIGLLAWLAVSFLIAALGAMASVSAPEFYGELIQPSWAPAASVFAPVWTFLFVLMAIAAWRVWRKSGFAANKVALALYFVQLLFNALWSWLFFEWHRGDFAFLDLIVLWGLILLTTYIFARVDRIAAWLLLPYLLWVTYAGCLNFALLQLNFATLS